MPITIKSTGMKYKNPDTGVYQGVDMLEEATIRDVIVDVYSPTLPYAVGEYCLYNGELYCCTTAIPAGGETWNLAHWDKTNVTDELENIKGAVDSIGSDDVANESNVSGTTVSDALDNLNGAIKDVLILEDGGISTVTGENAENVNRIRTKGFISPFFDITLPENYYVVYRYDYDSAGNFIVAQWMNYNTGRHVTQNITNNPNGYLHRLAISKEPEAPISTTDIGTNYTYYCQTDSTDSDLVGAITSLQTAVSKTNISETIFKDTSDICFNLNSQEYGLKGYTTTTSNSPVANTYGVCFCFGRTIGGSTWVYQYAFQTNGDIYIRTNINNGGWSAWDGLNTVETGTLTTTVLNDMYDKTVKKQGNVVNLILTTASGTSATINVNYTPVLATIPVGFRPPTSVFAPAVYYLNGTIATSTLASISSNGDIGLLTQSGGSTNIGYIRLMATYFV